MWRATNEAPPSSSSSGATAARPPGAAGTDAAHTPSPPRTHHTHHSTAASTSTSSSSSASDAMWRFDAPASASAAPTTATATATHGVIGSGNVHAASRFLWSRMAPEEEEREEEALPSYLSYLQPAFRAGDATASSSSFGVNTPSAFDSSLRRQSLPTPSLGPSAAALPFVPAAHQQQTPQAATAMYASSRSYASSYAHDAEYASMAVESKSKEFAQALQAFVRAQLEQQAPVAKSQPPGLHHAPLSGSSTCQCEPLKARVSELEHQLQTLQSQVTALVQGGMGNTSHAVVAGVPSPGPLPPLPAPGAVALAPPLPPGALPQPAQAGATPLAVAASQLPTTGASSAMSDRVSTLEGRQSAFQSQLAQISKVLGVPVGKHGKNNSQVKTLVQTLRDEIDAKVASGTLCTVMMLLHRTLRQTC